MNYAEGLVDRPYRPGVLFEGLATPEEIKKVAAVEAAFPELIMRLLPALAATRRDCPCPHCWSVTVSAGTLVRTGAVGCARTGWARDDARRLDG